MWLTGCNLTFYELSPVYTLTFSRVPRWGRTARIWFHHCRYPVCTFRARCRDGARPYEHSSVIVSALFMRRPLAFAPRWTRPAALVWDRAKARYLELLRSSAELALSCYYRILSPILWYMVIIMPLNFRCQFPHLLLTFSSRYRWVYKYLNGTICT